MNYHNLELPYCVVTPLQIVILYSMLEELAVATFLLPTILINIPNLLLATTSSEVYHTIVYELNSSNSMCKQQAEGTTYLYCIPDINPNFFIFCYLDLLLLQLRH